MPQEQDVYTGESLELLKSGLNLLCDFFNSVPASLDTTSHRIPIMKREV